MHKSLGNIHIQGPSNCSGCATNFFLRVGTGVGILCLKECLTDTYSPNNRTAGWYSNLSYTFKFVLGECLRCFEGCSSGYGCAGPGKTFNESNGCRRCDTIILDKYGEQVNIDCIHIFVTVCIIDRVSKGSGKLSFWSLS